MQASATFAVRPYCETDYEAFVLIDTATQSRAFWSEADWHPIHPPCAETPDARRSVVVHTPSGQIVGYGAVLLAEQSNLDVMVHPAWQRRGVGRLLWERMRQDLSAFGAVAVSPWVRAENTPALLWLEALGFAHVHKDGPVQIAPDAVDLSPFTAVAARLTAQGIAVTTLATERAPGYLSKLHALRQEVEQDVPGYSPSAQTSYAQFVQELAQPGMSPEGIFIAKHGEQYIGLSMLGRKVSESDLRFGGPNSLSQHLTGVRRAYRRRGVALALKTHAIAYAQQHGYRRILSNSDNPAMRALNWKLGFRTVPWLIYSHSLRRDHPTSGHSETGGAAL